ncbi:hypothetical protein F5888DRAFT_1693371 [Russula emetica]|nr:hypothetical protein F5888DRAFT_1693371 [Russula emetica]
MHASISKGMDMLGFSTNRFAPSCGVGIHSSETHHSAWFHPLRSQSCRPNLVHRASVPALLHASTMPTPNTLPSLSRKSSNAMCLLPRNSRTRSRGTIRIRSVLVRARWRSRQTQGVRLVCHLLVMGSPNADLRHLRTSTPNTPSPWRVGYTDARPCPSFLFMARGVTQGRRLALGAVPVPRARRLTTTTDEGRAYRQVSC